MATLVAAPNISMLCQWSRPPVALSSLMLSSLHRTVGQSITMTLIVKPQSNVDLDDSDDDDVPGTSHAHGHTHSHGGSSDIIEYNYNGSYQWRRYSSVSSVANMMDHDCGINWHRFPVKQTDIATVVSSLSSFVFITTCALQML
jgi:hypothetical protein